MWLLDSSVVHTAIASNRERENGKREIEEEREMTERER